MALIRIHADGTFETAHVEEATAAGHTTPAMLKTAMKVISQDKTTAAKIDALRAVRERAQHAHQAKGKTGPRTAAAYKARIDKINGVIKSLTSQMSGGKYVKPEVLIVRHQKAMARYTKLHAVLTGKAPAARTPRAPKDHGAAFERGAKKIAGTVSRGIRSELRDHGKTALVPVANRAGAKAPVAKPSGKTANTATTHATKPARGAIGNTLTEIKKIKASIATGELKGAKLIRAREELEKQREALRGLRAGKSPANQRAIVKPGTAKHMGGAKKIVAKPSGMGDASKTSNGGKSTTATVASMTDKLKRLRVKLKETNNAGQKQSLKRLIEATKERLVALKAKAK